MRKQRSQASVDGIEQMSEAVAEQASTTRGAHKKAAASNTRKKPVRQTAGRESLVKAAAAVLADVGFEKLTSNAICARAGVTPPTFYHYFKNKYEVLEELAEQLLGRQNEQFKAWLADYAALQEAAPPLDMIERWFVAVADFVAEQPGGIWTIRALRALPNLSHVRLTWQRRYSDQIHQALRAHTPESEWPLLWCRVRILVEFSYVVDELIYEEDRIARDLIIQEAARMIHSLFRGLVTA